jgi:hypothetical protein
MSIKISTGVRNHMLVTGSFKNAMDGGVLKIYAGTEPANADASIGSATLLCTVSNNSAGTGITFAAAASDGVLVKTASEVWSGAVTLGGVATFYRFVSLSDDGSLSTSAKRVQGVVGLVGVDLLVSTTTFVLGSTRIINSFTIGMPEA